MNKKNSRSDIKQHKKTPEILMFEISTFHQQGNIGKALKLCQQALLIFPKNLTFLKYAFVFSGMLKDIPLMEKYVRERLEVEPDNADSHSDLANLLQEQGQLGLATKHYQQAIKINPKHIVAYSNFAILLEKQGRFDDAEKHYRIVIRNNPNSAKTYCNLGTNLRKQKRFDEAEGCYQKALDIDPDYIRAQYNLANNFKDKKQFEQAEAYYAAVLKTNPNYIAAHNNLGDLYILKGAFDKAKKCFDMVLKLDANHVNAHCSLGRLQQVQGRYNEALDYYQKALKIDPDNAEAQWNFSLVLLTNGCFKEGWKNYESRHQKNKKEDRIILPAWSVPYYQGGSLLGKHLLIYAEQGVGDEIMFSSVLKDLASCDAKITLVCDNRLVDLFNRSFGFLNAIGKDEFNSSYQGLEAQIDCFMAIGSLPQFHRNDIKDFEKCGPYLQADEELFNKWRNRLSGLTHKMNIGISWYGGKQEEHKRSRSLALENWIPILKRANKNANIINLQYGDHQSEITEFEQLSGITIHDWKDADALADLDNFVAQIKALDAVISVDNSTVHFSGAIGVKTLVLLPFAANWRWGADREESYWYPSLRLFRQSENGDWLPVIDRIARCLPIK